MLLIYLCIVIYVLQKCYFFFFVFFLQQVLVFNFFLYLFRQVFTLVYLWLTVTFSFINYLFIFFWLFFPKIFPFPVNILFLLLLLVLLVPLFYIFYIFSKVLIFFCNTVVTFLAPCNILLMSDNRLSFISIAFLYSKLFSQSYSKKLICSSLIFCVDLVSLILLLILKIHLLENLKYFISFLLM